MSEGAARSEVTSQLLRQLADGRCHSGAELGRTLGVSRTAVWKQLRKLEDLGLVFESVRGQGYRLESPLELLDARRIERALSATSQQLLDRLDVFAHTDSTNARALAGSSGSGKGYVCLAEYQESGRGRRGRPWVSPFGRNLYLSLSWGYNEGVAGLEGLSLAVGSLLCESLEYWGLRDLELKWPNDLLWQGRKLAGVLLEVQGDPSGQCQLVVGLGVNFKLPERAAGGIDQPWADLEQLCEHQMRGGDARETKTPGPAPSLPGRNALAASLIDRLLPLLAQFPETGFEPYRAVWQSRDCLAGRPVILSSAREALSGIARGVNSQGALKLEVEGQVRLCYGGELSVRPVS